MKTKSILGMIVSAVLIITTIAACVPPAVQQMDQSAASEALAQRNGNDQDPVNGNNGSNGERNSLIIATQNEAPSVAPARHSVAASSFKNVMTHNGLFRSDYATLAPVPDLVAEWRAVSDVLFEFRLYEGILFHNGEEMTAYDVVASFYYVRNYPDARSSHLSAVAAEVVDRYTFTIYTGSPNASLFFDLTAHGNFVMPKSLIEGGHDFTVAPIGSGPFVFEEWASGDYFRFSRFDGYFDTERMAQIEYVTWRVIPEGASRTIALENGEVDLIIEVPEADVPRLEENPDISVFMREGTAFHKLLLNHLRHPFDNIVVRQALNMAIDQEALVMAAFEGLAVPLRAQVPTVFPGTNDDGVLPFDPEGARALLAEHNIDPATLGFDMIASSEERMRMAVVVQAQLLDIGIPTTITVNDHATTIDRSLNEDYDALFGMFNSSNLISGVRTIYHGGLEGFQNRNRINNPELNELIDLAIATIDTDERNAVFEDISRKVNGLAVNVPTHLPITIRAFNSNLVVPEIGADGSMNLNMVNWSSQ